MVFVTFRLDNDSKYRGEGWVSVEYSSTSEEQKVIGTTEDELAAVFKNAKSSGGSLDGADASIDAAIDDPLQYLDYLTLEGEEIVFDEMHSRLEGQS